jgi:hypothetical protein
MEPLVRAYEGKADFYVLYTREAHPGENYPAHESFSDKMNDARDLKRFEPVERTILVDDLEGTMHTDYGARPNSVYVIGKDGIILFRADWNDPEAVQVQLDRLFQNDGNASGLEPVDITDDFTGIDGGAVNTAMRVMKRAGYTSIVDFAVSSMNLFQGRIAAQRN